MSNAGENKTNIAIARTDMTMLHSTLPMSSFGLLSVSFAQQVFDRGRSTSVLPSMFTLDYLKERESDARQAVVAPVLKLDLSFVLQQMEKLAEERERALPRRSSAEPKGTVVYQDNRTEKTENTFVQKVENVYNTTVMLSPEGKAEAADKTYSDNKAHDSRTIVLPGAAGTQRILRIVEKAAAMQNEREQKLNGYAMMHTPKPMTAVTAATGVPDRAAQQIQMIPGQTPGDLFYIEEGRNADASAKQEAGSAISKKNDHHASAQRAETSNKAAAPENEKVRDVLLRTQKTEVKTAFVRTEPEKRRLTPAGVWKADAGKKAKIGTPQLEMLFSNVIQAEQNLGLTYGDTAGRVPHAPQERIAYLKETTRLIQRREQLAEAAYKIPAGVLPPQDLAFIQQIAARPGTTEPVIAAAEDVIYRTMELVTAHGEVPQQNVRENRPIPQGAATSVPAGQPMAVPAELVYAQQPTPTADTPAEPTAEKTSFRQRIFPQNRPIPQGTETSVPAGQPMAVPAELVYAQQPTPAADTPAEPTAEKTSFRQRIFPQSRRQGQTDAKAHAVQAREQAAAAQTHTQTITAQTHGEPFRSTDGLTSPILQDPQLKESIRVLGYFESAQADTVYLESIVSVPGETRFVTGKPAGQTSGGAVPTDAEAAAMTAHETFRSEPPTKRARLIERIRGSASARQPAMAQTTELVYSEEPAKRGETIPVGADRHPAHTAAAPVPTELSYAPPPIGEPTERERILEKQFAESGSPLTRYETVIAPTELQYAETLRTETVEKELLRERKHTDVIVQPPIREAVFSEAPVETQYIIRKDESPAPQMPKPPASVQEDISVPVQQTFLTPQAAESAYVKNLPEWAQTFLKNGYQPGSKNVRETAPAAQPSAPQGIQQQAQISWSNPRAEAMRSQSVPVQEIALKKNEPKEPETARISEAEIRHTADRVYKIIEERLRKERRRNGW